MRGSRSGVNHLAPQRRIAWIIITAHAAPKTATNKNSPCDSARPQGKPDQLPQGSGRAAEVIDPIPAFGLLNRHGPGKTRQEPFPVQRRERDPWAQR
jgi:hypothetical protein